MRMQFNKAQRTVFWVVSILLSAVSVGWGGFEFSLGEPGDGTIFCFIVPILLIGAAAFLAASGRLEEEKRGGGS